MNQTIEKLTEQATSRLAADHQAARKFDAAAGCTAATRKAAVLATLAAAREKQAENHLLRQRRDATKRRIAALQVATALASKTATAPRPAAPAPRPPTAAPSRPDKRQGSLPLEQWCLEHVFRLAIAGDSPALAEIRRRGFAIGPHGMSRSMKA